MLKFKHLLFIYVYIISSYTLTSYAQSVVAVQDFDRRGTAFYIGEGKFVTNFHIMQGNLKSFNNYFIRILDTHKNDHIIYIKTILHLDALNDLAVVQVHPKNIPFLDTILTPLTISKSIKLTNKLSYKVISVDYHSHKKPIIKTIPLLSPSIMIPFYTNDTQHTLKIHSSSLIFGMSGSPVLVNNKVIGIVRSSKFNLAFGLATSSLYLLKLLKTKPLNCINHDCVYQEIEDIKTKAENNNIHAQYILSKFYTNGIRVKKNKTIARYWLTKAAKQTEYQPPITYFSYNNFIYNKKNMNKIVQDAKKGHAESQYQLSTIYYFGNTYFKQIQTMYWLKKAAQQGHIEAQYNLGKMYLHRKGILKNLNQAHYWLLKAAQQDHREAQYELSLLYSQKNEIYTDLEKADYWLLKSAMPKDTNK